MSDDQPTLFDDEGDDNGAGDDHEGMVENPAQADTSAQAARRVKPLTGKQRLLVLAAITAAGDHGLTDEEGMATTGLGPNSYRPRRVELAKGYKDIPGGWVAHEDFRDGASGYPAKVWIATGKKP